MQECIREGISSPRGRRNRRTGRGRPVPRARQGSRWRMGKRHARQPGDRQSPRRELQLTGDDHGDPARWDIVSQNAPVAAERCGRTSTRWPAPRAEGVAGRGVGGHFPQARAKRWSEVKVAVKPNASGVNNNTGSRSSARSVRADRIGRPPRKHRDVRVQQEGKHGYGHRLSPVRRQRASGGHRLSDKHESMGGR